MNDYQDQSSSSNGNSKRIYYIALIGILLLINGLLFYSNYKMKRENTMQVDSLQSEKASLQAEYNTMLQELENYKTQNSTLDSTLASTQGKIEEQKAKIEQLLRSSGGSRKELEQTRALIASLRTNVDEYKLQIEALTAANQDLTTKNSGLQQDIGKQRDTIKTLATEKETLTTEKQQLQTEKEGLSSEKEALTQDKTQLTQKVNKANSVIRAANITAQAVKLRKNGKEVSVKSNKRADEFKICFDIVPNAAARPSDKEIMARIINPKGEVLAVQELGGGIFTNEATGESMQYTQKAMVDYTGDAGQACINCKHNAEFMDGKYKVELYNEGYYIGGGQVTLK